tara:strand:+ start:3842 stop:4267 length:426 start_codon:yes stop_codon:yes gene_type:complete
MNDINARVKKLVHRLENDLNELICESVEDGISSYHDEKLNQTLENISKKHQISLELLLRDIPKIEGVDRCRGIKPGGVRCSFKAGENGYCKFHQRQSEKVQPRCLPSLQLHNHGSEKMFVRGCPGCEQKGLIELGRLFSND